LPAESETESVADDAPKTKTAEAEPTDATMKDDEGDDEEEGDEET